MPPSRTEDTDPLTAMGSIGARAASARDGRPVTVLDHEVTQARRRVDELRGEVLAEQERNERTITELRARIAEERRRADDAEDALAALRRRAGDTASEVRAAEERLAAERSERERTVSELAALLDDERRRAGALSGDAERQLAELRGRLVESERDAEHERSQRHRERFDADQSADERVEVATREADAAAQRARADLDARDQHVRDLAYQLAAERERAGKELTARERELQEASARAVEAETELKDVERARFVAETGIARLETQLASERDRAAGAVERERALAATLEQSRAAQSAAQQRADTLSARIREVEQARDTARASERQSLVAAERNQGALDVRERELAAARAEAAGATDALVKLQRELGAAQAGIASTQQELHEQRVNLGTAKALLEREREQHAVRLQDAAAQAHAALTAEQEARRRELAIERATFEQERATFEQRLAAVQAQADEQLAAARAAHTRERDQLEHRVSALRGDIEATIGGLRTQLEEERGRTQTLTTDLRADVDSRETTVTVLQSELEASRRRADTIVEELAQRDAMVAKVSGVARELRTGLEDVRGQLEVERVERSRTDDAARRVLAAAGSLLRRSKSGDVTVQDVESEIAEARAFADVADVTADEPASVGELEWAAERPDAAAPPAGGSGNLQELLDRFDQIRSQLADQGLGTAPDAKVTADEPEAGEDAPTA